MKGAAAKKGIGRAGFFHAAFLPGQNLSNEARNRRHYLEKISNKICPNLCIGRRDAEKKENNFFEAASSLATTCYIERSLSHINIYSSVIGIRRGRRNAMLIGGFDSIILVKNIERVEPNLRDISKPRWIGGIRRRAGNRRTTTPLPTKFPDFALCMADGADGRTGGTAAAVVGCGKEGRKEADLSSRNAVFHNRFGCRGERHEGSREGCSQ